MSIRLRTLLALSDKVNITRPPFVTSTTMGSSAATLSFLRRQESRHRALGTVAKHKHIRSSPVGRTPAWVRGPQRIIPRWGALPTREIMRVGGPSGGVTDLPRLRQSPQPLDVRSFCRMLFARVSRLRYRLRLRISYLRMAASSAAWRWPGCLHRNHRQDLRY